MACRPDTADDANLHDAGRTAHRNVGNGPNGHLGPPQIEASGYRDIRNLKRRADGWWHVIVTKNDIEVAASVDSTDVTLTLRQMPGTW